MAAYPFTTINPFVGIMEFEDYSQIAGNRTLFKTGLASLDPDMMVLLWSCPTYGINQLSLCNPWVETPFDLANQLF